MTDFTEVTIRNLELLAEEWKKVKEEKDQNFWWTEGLEYVEKEIEVMRKILDVVWDGMR